MDERFEVIEQLRGQRKTYKEIATILGVSKQRIHQIYKNYETLDPKISQRIKKQNGNKCEICGTDENLEVHHKDRNTKNNNIENLNVFCDKHHKFIEKEIKRLQGIKKDSLGTNYKENICQKCNKKYKHTGYKKRKFCSRNCFNLIHKKYKNKKEKWAVSTLKYYHKILKNNPEWVKKNREYQRKRYFRSNKLSTVDI